MTTLCNYRNSVFGGFQVRQFSVRLHMANIFSYMKFHILNCYTLSYQLPSDTSATGKRFGSSNSSFSCCSCELSVLSCKESGAALIVSRSSSSSTSYGVLLSSAAVRRSGDWGSSIPVSRESRWEKDDSCLDRKILENEGSARYDLVVDAGGGDWGTEIVSLELIAGSAGLVRGEDDPTSELGVCSPDEILLGWAGLVVVNYRNESYSYFTYLVRSFSPLVTVRRRFFKFGNVWRISSARKLRFDISFKINQHWFWI